jgi:hypothetical protein
MEESNRFLVQEMEDLEFHPLEEIKYSDIILYQKWLKEQLEIIETKIFK